MQSISPKLEVEYEATIRLAGEGDAGDDAIDLELEAGRLDGLLQEGQQLVVGPGQLVGVEADLARDQGEVPALRLNLGLEDCRKLELWVVLAEQGLVQMGLHVGVEAGAHGHRRLLGQPWGGMVRQVAEVEFLRVLFPEGHGRIAEAFGSPHGSGPEVSANVDEFVQHRVVFLVIVVVVVAACASCHHAWRSRIVFHSASI